MECFLWQLCLHCHGYCLQGGGCWWLMLLSVSPVMAQSGTADSVGRDGDRVWRRHRVTQNMAGLLPESLRTGWTTTYREAQSGDLFMLCLRNSPHIQQGGNLYLSSSLSCSQFPKEWKGRESCCFLLNYGHLAIPSADIIPPPFSLTSEICHAAIWDGGFASGSQTGVFNMFLSRSVTSELHCMYSMQINDF